jgi:flagellar protein FlaI
VVGEIRGEEAFVLFQALATGHGGLTTLHAENIDYAVKRLTSRPMNVAESYIPLLNVVPVIERVKLPATRGSATFGRRIKSLIEIVDYNKYRTVCNWDPVMDRFDIDLSKSYLFGRIAERQGLNLKDVLAEAHKRVLFLKDLQKRGIRDNIELAKHITNYYNEINHLGVQVDEAK